MGRIERPDYVIPHASVRRTGAIGPGQKLGTNSKKGDNHENVRNGNDSIAESSETKSHRWSADPH
jgi:hypothetical protein